MSIRKQFSDVLDKVENYESAKADNFVGWDLHHRLETHFPDGTPRPKNEQLKAAELIALDKYWNRPAEELIFLRHGEHSSLHRRGNTGYKLSEETKQKISNAMTGERNPFYGKKHSEETKRGISDKKKGSIPWNKGKKCPPSWNKGKHWSEETRRKISEAMKNRKKKD